MRNKEFDSLMRHLIAEHVEPNVRRTRNFCSDWSERWNDLLGLTYLIRAQQHLVITGDDKDDSWQRSCSGFLSERLVDCQDWHKQLLDESGFLDILDTYGDAILQGMRIDHIPGADLNILRQLGSVDPRGELLALMHLARSRKCEQAIRRYRDPIDQHEALAQVTTSEALGWANRMTKSLLEDAYGPKPAGVPETVTQPSEKRRWWKGLGQIGKGLALSVADVGLAVGLINLPVPDSTATWGALVSSITGVSGVVTGVGELLGE